MFLEHRDLSGCTDVILPKWDELARLAADPNPFYEHWFLLPAIREMASANVYLLFVWDDEKRSRLLGMFPLCIENSFRGLPIKRTGLWRHPYCYLCTPLMHRDQTVQVLAAVFEWIRNSDELPSFASFYWMNGDAVLAENWHEVHSNNQPMQEAANSTATTLDHDGDIRSVKRAVLPRTGDFTADFLPSIRTKKRKEWSRNWRRLAELGDIKTEFFSANSSQEIFDGKITEFLELEDRGWKHEKGTSLNSSTEHARFFHSMLASGHSRDQAIILQITLDTKPIGMITVITSACGRAAYTLKIASDHEYQRFSIGSQVILRLTEYALASMTVDLIDSCAAEDNEMINRVWPARRRIVNLHFANKNPTVKAIIPLTDLTTRIARMIPRLTA